MNLLEVEEIDVFYGPIQALRGVSLTVAEGEMVCLLGANGAGKTTTLRSVSQLIEPRRGKISFEGHPLTGVAPQDVVRRGITHLPEGRDLFSSLTVFENLRMGYWVKRGNSAGMQPRIDHVMDLFPWRRERSGQAAGTLSGGEQQMLGVARALMSSPRLLIIDELSLGLAPMVVTQLFEVLAAVNSEGTAILLVEQFVHRALENTARAYVLTKGEVTAQGTSASLLKDPALIESYLGGAVEGAASSA